MARRIRRRLLATGGLGAALCLAALLAASGAWAAAGWSPQSSGTSTDLSAVAFTDATDGWAVGAAGTILRTTDGGLSWTTQASSAPAANDLNGVAVATDGLRGSAVGAAGTVLRTLDGGVAD